MKVSGYLKSLGQGLFEGTLRALDDASDDEARRLLVEALENVNKQTWLPPAARKRVVGILRDATDQVFKEME